MRKLGISVVSMWPYTLGSRGPSTGVEMALKAGFDGVQALPLRGWDSEELKDTFVSKNIISYEDSWGYGSFFQSVLGSLRGSGPSLIDWMLFDDENSLASHITNGSVFVSHHFSKGHIVEIHPELSVRIVDYQRHIQSGGYLCWDTLHTKRPHRKTHVRMPFQLRLFEELYEGIKIVHLHCTYKEVEEFLKLGLHSNFGKDIAFLDDNLCKNVPFILEVFPLILVTGNTLASMTDFSIKIRSCMS